MKVTVETLQLILFLMPGFVGAGVHGYVRNTTLAPTGFLILAVMIGTLSAFVTALVGIAPSNYLDSSANPDYYSQVEALVRVPYFWGNTTSAIVFGFGTALAYENRRVQHALQKLGLTRHYSTDDVWEQTFRDNNGRWLVLHLKDGRKLIGYAHYYSMTGQDNMLTLRDASLVAEQLEGDSDEGNLLPNTQMRGDLLVTDMSDVFYIEFIDPGIGADLEKVQHSTEPTS